MKYDCAIIGTSTKSNIKIDKNYILYFKTNGEVFIKNELHDGRMPLNYVESRQEYLK